MDLSQSVDLFFSGWNEPDAAARARIWARCLDDPFYYADPRAPDGLTGAGFADHVGGFFAFDGPPLSMRLDGDPEFFGRHGRFQFVMEKEGDRFGSGSYVGEFADDGRLRRVVGFVGRMK